MQDKIYLALDSTDHNIIDAMDIFKFKDNEIERSCGNTSVLFSYSTANAVVARILSKIVGQVTLLGHGHLFEDLMLEHFY